MNLIKSKIIADICASNMLEAEKNALIRIVLDSANLAQNVDWLHRHIEQIKDNITRQKMELNDSEESLLSGIKDKV